MNSHDCYTQKKCTFGVHFGSTWVPHVPKTLLFTMNFNDFRGVVFVAPNEPKRSSKLVKMASGSADEVQIVHPSRHLFAQMIVKTYQSQTSKKLKFRCRPSIYQTRADNEYETNVNVSSRLHSLASR